MFLDDPTAGSDDQGVVFNIQKFSLHDGEGIRTLVFLKGCPLRCRWCSNPEGMKPRPELAYKRTKCIGMDECGFCENACPQGAMGHDGEGLAVVDRNRCDDCWACDEACPSKALVMLGETMSVDAVLDVAEEDSVFYARSKGGLTVGGGEPLSQPGFARKLLLTARERGFRTALETSGQGRWEDLERICQHVDHVHYDIKCLDDKRHREFTQVGNDRILENLNKLGRRFVDLPITVRTPIVTGHNDTVSDIAAIAEYVGQLPGKLSYELLAYHAFGATKYEQLGLSYCLEGLKPPDDQVMDVLRERAQLDQPRLNNTGSTG